MNVREVRRDWAVVGVKNASEFLLLKREGPPLFCIWPDLDAEGGWRYRNEWAALMAFDGWEGFGRAAPMAGEWRDFPK